MSPKKRRRRGPVHGHRHRCYGQLAIASVRVINREEPLRLVMRYADGAWAFLCNTTAHPDDLITVHAHHLFDDFPADLEPLRSLPPAHLAERQGPGHPWLVEPYDEE